MVEIPLAELDGLSVARLERLDRIIASRPLGLRVYQYDFKPDSVFVESRETWDAVLAQL